mgnify:CR=1 FL=1
MISKRRDDKGRVLQQGEWQEPSGRYRYKYTDSLGKRKILYSWRLTEADKMPEGKRADLSLREKERKVQSLQMQGITGSNITVLELVERYLSLKTGVKHNTLANYKFVVNVLKKEEFAYKKVDDVKLSDAKIFLIKLQRDGRGYSSIHSIRGVLRPAFQMAVDDDLILKNPFGFELGTVLVNDSQKRQAVSPEDETKFLDFVKNDPHYNQYYDAFYILFKTGLRISEFCGLTVKDLDFKEDIINVNHQLQRTREMKYIIVSTKTTSGTRLLPMEADVKEAFLRILKNRRKPKREPMVDGYGGFLFLDKNGRPKRKKRFGHSIQNRCPGYFQAKVKQLFESTGGTYIEVPSDYRASQYDHTVDDYIKKKLSQRMYNLKDGTKVQRDWYSSFLLYCIDLITKTIDRQKCLVTFETQLNKEHAMIEEIIHLKKHIMNSGIRVAV